MILHSLRRRMRQQKVVGRLDLQDDAGHLVQLAHAQIQPALSLAHDHALRLLVSDAGEGHVQAYGQHAVVEAQDTHHKD